MGDGAEQEVLDARPQTHDVLTVYSLLLGLVIGVLALLSELQEEGLQLQVSEADGLPGGPHPPEALGYGNKLPTRLLCPAPVKTDVSGICPDNPSFNLTLVSR